jgi:hypothetical protein
MMDNWHVIKTRRDIPKAGSRILVTRQWKSGKNEVKVARVVLYKNKKHFIKDFNYTCLRDAYPYDNVIAWMEMPEPFEE